MVAHRQVYRRNILTEENKRPNANYNLSYPGKPEGGGKENVTFYYNRERRLASAPKAVQDLYEESKPGRFGLFGALIADKPRRALFVTIVILCAIILIVSKMGLLETSVILDGNRLDISGTYFEDTVIVLVKKTAKDAQAYAGEVNIAVSVPMPHPETALRDEGEYPFFTHRIYFTLEKDEVYRFAVPFNAPELLVVLQSDKSEVRHKFKPE